MLLDAKNLQWVTRAVSGCAIGAYNWIGVPAKQARDDTSSG
jgi:hypothetical protein